MTEDDLDVIIKLITEIFGDLYMRTGLMPWQIDTAKCPESQLEALSSLIGYDWNPNLTADQQRMGIDLYCLIRRNRGTIFGLENLIRTFGQTVKEFYSSSDLRGVEVVEYGSGGPETLEPNMFPGDIIVRAPDFSSILRDSIFDTKLAGTRLFFEYYIFLGIFHLSITTDFGWVIRITPDMLIQGYDPTIDEFADGWNVTLGQLLEHQLTHGIRGNIANSVTKVGHNQNSLHKEHHGNLVAGIQVLTYYKAPWINGFILATPGLTNYRGFVQPTEHIETEEILYK